MPPVPFFFFIVPLELYYFSLYNILNKTIIAEGVVNLLPFYEYKNVLLQSRRQTENFNFPLHMHDRPEFMYINKGSLNIDFLSKKIALNQGDFVIIFPFTVHGYETVNKEETDYTLAICRTEDCGEFKDILLNKHPSSPNVTAKKLHDDVPRIMKEFVTLGENNSNKILIRALIQLLLARILPELNLKTNSSNIEANNIVKVLHYVTDHYNESLTLENVSKIIGISRFALSRLFNDHIHAGFLEYINYLRIEHAKELLLTTNMSVIDIAMTCGYENLRTFNRVFKNILKISPLQYRKQS